MGTPHIQKSSYRTKQQQKGKKANLSMHDIIKFSLPGKIESTSDGRRDTRRWRWHRDRIASFRALTTLKRESFFVFLGLLERSAVAFSGPLDILVYTCFWSVVWTFNRQWRRAFPVNCTWNLTDRVTPEKWASPESTCVIIDVSCDLSLSLSRLLFRDLPFY